MADYIGTPGNDTLTALSSDVEAWIPGTLGDDIILLSDMTAGSTAYVYYSQTSGLTSGLTFAFNGHNGDGQISGAEFTDAVILGDNALQLWGTPQDDIFTLIVPKGADWEVVGWEGQDRYELMLYGDLWLSFYEGTTGIRVDLLDNQVYRDGTVDIDTANEALYVDDQGGQLNIRGGYFNDIVTGSHRDEGFEGQMGDDTFLGNGGVDTFYMSYQGASGSQSPLEQAQASFTVVSGGVEVTSPHGTDLLIDVEQIVFSDGTVAVADIVPGQTLLGSNDADDTLTGNMGHDTFDAGRGNDEIIGLGGDDAIWADGGDDLVLGGSGNDTLRGGRGSDYLDGGSGDDSLVGQRDGDTLSGGDGADTLKGGGGQDRLYGNDGDDFLKGGTYQDLIFGDNGDDTLIGNRHNDSLYGGAGDDSLNAGGDDDFLFGQEGNDWLKGGSGADVFMFALDGGQDTIADFDTAEDLLILYNLFGWADAEAVASVAQVTNAGIALSFDTGEHLLLEGLSDIDALIAATQTSSGL
ncbi:calcium-binding protein [Tropicibacter naphthalenivorans]|uniref:Hemolysin IA n=1 Tax=Tropicibacter naphthalenivorans TaxID=441103 RepID=A0A0P1GKK4_9RHOB|nr:calcium-binding protein [Tropicibacter naphthalenivorans]CUH82622.1 Hemolysin IA [Tropicibacter naphthalenivorans]SMD08919.1 Hemolysin-type calcium-binding repeat-containing protein [Tropicibacter naphthalenivorans]